MENGPTRRHLLSPRSPSATDLSSHRRSSLQPLHTPATTLGSGSGSPYYQMPPLPLAPTAGDDVDIGAGGRSSHARSFSQPSFFSSAPGSLAWPDLDADLDALAATPPQSQSNTFSGFSQSNLSPLPRSLPPVAEHNDLVDLDDPDDIVSQFLDLNGLGELTSLGDGTEELHGLLAASHLSGGPLASGLTNSSKNVAESCAMSSVEKNYGSSSVDSFTGNLNSGSKENLPLPFPGAGAAAIFEHANGKFSEARMKKIMADQHLAELMLTDPVRAKRLLNNRQSSAKAQERKALYRSELERKFQKLKMEASSLSTQLTWLQTKSAELTTQNNELKFKLESVEKLGHLKHALNEALRAQIQRLKLTTDKISHSQMPNSPYQQMISSQMIQFQEQIQEQPSQPDQTQPQQEQFNAQLQW